MLAVTPLWQGSSSISLASRSSALTPFSCNATCIALQRIKEREFSEKEEDIISVFIF
jgi:hypothetical protein